MEQLALATLYVKWHNRAPETIPVQYNPTELSFDKSVQLAEVAIPGLDAPLQQFVRGQAEKVTLELFFDTTDDGMGAGATSVTTKTDKIYQLIKIQPSRHAPPVCVLVWGESFPGDSVDGTTTAANVGGQNRNGFQCVVESVRQRFTLFSPEGVPLRATVTVTLREYKTLGEQLPELNPNSPDRTHSRTVGRSDTLGGIAADTLGRADAWRHIADANGIEDPRRLTVGAVLVIPPLDAERRR